MFRQLLVATTLASLVSVPGFLVGEKLRHADLSGLMLLMFAILIACTALVAGAIMRSMDR